MKKNSHSSETDLFNESIKGATPLKNNLIHNTNPKHYPNPKQTITDNRLVLNESIKKNNTQNVRTLKLSKRERVYINSRKK